MQGTKENLGLTGMRLQFKAMRLAVKKLIPVFAFISPFLILYYFYPASFDMTWKGRTYCLFFTWLMVLETIISWEELEGDKFKKNIMKALLLLISCVIPTIYAVITSYIGLNTSIIDFALQRGIDRDSAVRMPLAIEYLVFTVSLSLIILSEYGIEKLSKYSVSTFFLGIIGLVYLVDDLYPYGKFTPFQIVVPTTTQLAANILNAMGFRTSITMMVNPKYGSLTVLSVYNLQGNPLVGFGVGWPCAGVDSLLLYSTIVVLFLKKSSFSLKASIACFLVGAVVTYFINIIRIVSIFIIAINGGDWIKFHDYYGPLYSIIWITIYPLIILGTQSLRESWRLRKHLSRSQHLQRDLV
ncbi:MAG: archaeosortase/exosortase family protein [Candidatus Bathyarchaeia archaeon]